MELTTKLKRHLLYALPVLMLCIQANNAIAHAEHGAGEPQPQISQTASLPKTVGLQIVKTTAPQFVLSAANHHLIEVFGEGSTPFLKFDHGMVYANFNNPDWFRAQQPGGGAVPKRLKTGIHSADWRKIADNQQGLGWYDPRLTRESLKQFNLILRIDKKKHQIRIKRTTPTPFEGFWTNQITTSEESFASIGLSAFLPGLTAGTITWVSDSKPDDPRVWTILDEQSRPLIRRKLGQWWINTQNPTSSNLGLGVSEVTDTTEIWQSISASTLLTVQDSRLGTHAIQQQKSTTREALEHSWSISVETTDQGLVSLQGVTRWQAMNASPPSTR